MEAKPEPPWLDMEAEEGEMERARKMAGSIWEGMVSVLWDSSGYRRRANG